MGIKDSATKEQNEHQPDLPVNLAMQELHDIDALKEKLKNRFDCYYQCYIEREFKDFIIKTNKKINKHTNEIISIHLQSIDSISLQNVRFTV